MSRLLLIILLAWSIPPAAAWDGQGHQLIGSIADQLLEGAPAGAQVREILGYDLRTASTWPDCARGVRRSGGGFTYHAGGYAECQPFSSAEETARLVDYARRNWSNCAEAPSLGGRSCHALYHFADIAFQRGHYESTFAGTADVDIVHAINAAITVLQGKAAPAPFSIVDGKEALLMLTHFVGDLTQPLHVGAVWLAADGTIVDPDTGGTDLASSNTRGGNSIRFAGGDLHTLWDHIPTTWGTSADADLVTGAREIPATSAPIGELAALWAGETVRQVRPAIVGLTFGPKVDGKWNASAEDAKVYRGQVEAIQRYQIAMGGTRLAELLKRIWP
jgi:S1/P1 Nuclease